MQLCNCSLPCCFSARWCHRLSRQGWEGDLGRWWRSVCVWSRGGVFLPDCIIKLLRQALSALSCLFSSLFATSRLLSSRRGICCSNSEVFRGGVSGWVGRGVLAGTKRQIDNPPALSLWNFFFITRHKYLPRMMRFCCSLLSDLLLLAVTV